MSEATQSVHLPDVQRAFVRAQVLAERCDGVVARRQLLRVGVGRGSIERWLRSGVLTSVYPAVYAFGHGALSLRGRLSAALLYAGPGAALSHGTAAFWWRLLAAEPLTFEVVTPRRLRPQPGMIVRRRADLVRVSHDGLPVTAPAVTIRDMASRLTERSCATCWPRPTIAACSRRSRRGAFSGAAGPGTRECAGRSPGTIPSSAALSRPRA